MRYTKQPVLTPSVRSDRLRHLYSTNRCARALLNHAAKQTGAGAGDAITVDSLHGILSVEHKLVISRRELTRALRAVAETGTGRFVLGRGGKPSRFIWTTPPATLADPIAPGSSPSANNTAPAPSHNARSMEQGLFAHSFRLRQDLVVSLHLPVDLRVREAERLAQFIQTLPLKDEPNTV